MFLKKNKVETFTYGIIGLNNFGRELAISLAKSGKEVMVIDTDPEVVDELREGLKAHVGGVGGGLVMADSDNPLAVARSAAACEQANGDDQGQQEGYPFCVFHKKHSSLQKFLHNYHSKN